MRSKVKMSSSEEILKNFTREFLIEEKKRCEIDRYIVDFRILIHKRPHENHNYINRLLQEYTSMFLSHERISANKLNEDEMKFNLRTHIASRKKNSPKQRYVKSKLLTSNNTSLKHESYSILRAKTKDFLKRIKEYEELEQIAYEIFLKNSTVDFTEKKSKNISEGEVVLKLKTSSTLGDLPIEKPKNLYIVTSQFNTPVEKMSSRNSQISNENKMLLKNYEYLKDETVKFLHENKNYNEAEQKILSQQYRDNIFIKNYVDGLISSSKNSEQSIPKKGILSRIKNIIGFSPENTTKFYKNIENKNLVDFEKTRIFLRYEKKYNNFEFQAYKLFYIENGEFQNPLIKKIQTVAYGSSENTKEESPTHKTPTEKKKIKIKNLVGLKSPKTEILKSNNEKEQFEQFNIIKYSPNQNTPKMEEGGENIRFRFNETKSRMETEIDNFAMQLESKDNGKSIDERMKELRELNREFLHEQKIYENKQKIFHEQFLEKHPSSIKQNMKKESILRKIKQLFKFGKNEKPKEKLKYFKEVTEEFLKNEQYFYEADRPTSRAISEIHASKLHLFDDSNEKMIPSKAKNEEKKTIMKTMTISPVKLHQRSRSEDLLLFKARKKSSENQNKKSPTSPKTFSDRLKSMVGIGNRRRTKSREGIPRPTDSIQYFLDQERMNYDLDSEISKKYSRNFHILSDPANKGTLKTKTRMFLSTENMLYNDQTNLSKNKPPSGRGRKEKRSDKNNKRRSRTLSPAQKLVSKLKNMVSRDNVKAKSSNNGRLIDETHKFIEDHKKFNDSLGGDMKNLLTIRKINIKVKHSNTKSVPIDAEANSPSTNVNNITTTLPHLSKDDNFEGKKEITENTINHNELNTINTQMNTNITNQKSMKSPKKISVRSTTAEGTNIFDSPEFIISRTRIFLHDMKKYNDLDKEPNIADKTLIFINNRNQPSYHPKDQNLLINKIQTQSQGIDNSAPPSQTPRKKQEKSNNSEKDFHREVHGEHEIHISTNSQQYKGHDTSIPIISEKESSRSNRIEKKTVQKTMRSETKFTHETVSRTITKSHHQKEIQVTNRSISKIATDKLKSTENSQQNERSKIPLETSEKDIKKILNCNSLQTHYSAPTEYHDTKQINIMTTIPVTQPNLNNLSIENKSPTSKHLNNSSKDSALKETKFHEKNKELEENIYIQSDQLKVDTKQTTPQKISNLKPRISGRQSAKMSETKDHKLREIQLKHETHGKKSLITDNNDANLNSMKNLNKTFLLEHQDYHHKQNLGYNNSLKKVDQPKSQLGITSTENERKENSIASVKDSWSSENSRDQLEKFLHQMRAYCDEEKRSWLKHNIEWLSDSKDNTYQQKIGSSENAVSGLKHFPTIKQDTDAFLRNQKEYQNKQRVEELNFCNKIEKPQNQISSDFAKKEKKNIIEKVKNFLSPKSSKKIAKSDGIKNTVEFKNLTEEFLRNHQYLIHREEIELNKPSNIEQKHVYSENSPMKTHNNGMDAENKMTANTSSTMKNFVSLNNEPSCKKEHITFIKNETIEFLQNLKNYSDGEKENLTKYKINWLCDNTKPLKKLDTQTEKIEKKILTRDPNEKQFSVLKQANKLFLTDVKNYHDTEKVEEYKFFDKIGKTRTTVWLTPKKENLIAEVESLVIPKHIKEHQTVIANDSNRISMEQTNEFIQRQHYLIHPDELIYNNMINSPTKNVIEKESLQENIQKPKAVTDKTKKGTFSKIMNFMTGSAKSLLNKENFEYVKKQTQSFLEDHKDYHNNQRVEEHNFIEKREMSQPNIWLTPIKKHQQMKNQPSMLNTETVSVPDEQQINQVLRKEDALFMQRNPFTNQRTETINKKQPIEDTNESMISQTSSMKNTSSEIHGKPLTRKVENKTRAFSSIPQTLKENSISSEQETINVLKEQTAMFLKNHQYFIHKEETKFNNIHDPHLADSEKETVKQREYSELHNSPKEYTTDKPIINKKKTRKGPFSKITDFITGAPKHTTNEEDVEIIKKQTEEFLLNLRVYENTEKESLEKCKIAWLGEDMKTKDKSSAKSIQSKQDQFSYQFLTQETKSFLDVHKDYHDKQRVEENNFLSKLEKLQYNVLLTPIKNKQETVVTKFEDGFSEGPKIVPIKENINALRNQTADFLKHHQYLIHRDEIEFKPIDKMEDTIRKVREKTVGLHPTNNSFDEKKTKKGVFTKLRSFVTGRPKSSPNEEDQSFLKKQTEELLSNLRDYGSVEKENITNNEVIWLSENAIINDKIQLNNHKIAKNENSYQNLREKTISFIKEHKTYHDKQKNEENKFMKKHVDIWLVPVKNDQKAMVLNSTPRESNILLVQENGSILRKQTANFLKNHQYLIYRDEIESHRAPIQLNEITVQDKNTRTIAENDKTAAGTLNNSTSNPKKNKNSALFKIKNFMTGISRHPPNKGNLSLIKRQTEDLLLNLKHYDSADKEYLTKNKVIWLSENKKNENALSMNDTKNKKIQCSYQMLRQQTISFLEDHKSYHDEQRSEENRFIEKLENSPHILISPLENDKNIIATKVTNSLSSKNTKKIPAQESDRILRNQTAIFLQNNQYLIYRDSLEDEKVSPELNQNLVENKVTQKKVVNENSLTKTKENPLARIKNFMKGSPKHPPNKVDLNIMKKLTEEFLLNSKEYNNAEKENFSKNKVVWISESIPINNKCLSKNAKDQANQYSYQVLRQQTISFLEDDKDYHNKQRNEDNNFISKLDKMQHISNKTVGKNDQKTIVKKMKNVFSSQKSEKLPSQEHDRILRDQTADFLQNHQYLIHWDEITFNKVPNRLSEITIKGKVAPDNIEKEKVAALQDPKQSTMKEKHPKKNAFAKLKNFMAGSSKLPPNKEDSIVMRNQTEKLLLNLKEYSDAEKENAAKNKIVWISEKFKVYDESPENYSKKKQIHNSYQNLRQETISFLEHHKDYHDKERAERNYFRRKNDKQNSSPALVKNNQKTVSIKLAALSSSQTIETTQIQKNEPDFKDKTADFLKKDKHNIYREEIEAGELPIQLSQDAFEHKINDLKEKEAASNVKNMPLSNKIKTSEKLLTKIKYFTSELPKHISDKEDLNLSKRQTAELLLNLKKYNSAEKENSAKNEIIWLNEDSKTSNKYQFMDPKNEKSHRSHQLLNQETNSPSENDNKENAEENNLKKTFRQPQHNANAHDQKKQDSRTTHILSSEKSENNAPEKNDHISTDPTTDSPSRFSNKLTEETVDEQVAQKSMSEDKNAPTKTKLFTKVKNLFSHNSQIGNSVFYNVFEPEPTDSKQQTCQFIEREQYHIHEDETNSKKIRKTDSPSKEKLSSNNENLQKKNFNSPKKKVTFVETEPTLPEYTNTHDVEYQHLIHETNSFLKDHELDQKNQSTVNQDTLLRTVKLTQGEHIIKKPILSNITQPVASISDELGEEDNRSHKLMKDESEKFLKCNRYLIHEQEISNNNSKLNSGNSEQQRQPQSALIIERNDKSSIETDDESEKIQILIQETDSFLADHKLYHENQWHLYQKFIQKHGTSDKNEKTISPKIEYDPSIYTKNLLGEDTFTSEQNNLSKSDFANNPTKKTIASAPIEETYHESRQSSQSKALQEQHRLKQQPETNHSSSKVFTPFPQKTNQQPLKDSDVSQLIKQKNIAFLDTELYLIHEDEINHNKNKPIPTPRKSKHKTESPYKEFDVFKTNHFLEDHKKYHNEERNEHINFLKEQSKSRYVSNSPTLSEPKIKQTFFSKLRSLVGSSQPSKVQSASLRKQTLEFLISQKCYNDLERTAALNFSEAILCKDKQLILGKKNSEEENNIMLQNEFDELKSTSSQVLIPKENLNTISSEHQGQQGKNKQPLRKDSELLSIENVGNLNKQNEDFITFFSTGKEQVHVSPRNGASKILNNEPQQTSANQKINERDIIMTSDCDSESRGINKSQIDYQNIKKSNQEFLDSQKYFIDAENKLWNSYIKYKPEAVVAKNISQSHGANSIKTTKRKYKKHEKLSGVESEKIDFEINLHKTKVFLEDLKKYNDYQQSFLSSVFQKPNSKPTVKEENGSVSNELKSLMSTEKIKNDAHDIQQDQDFPKMDSYQIFPEEIKRSQNEHYQVNKLDKTFIQETNFFLKNLQDYHNQEERLIEVSEIPPSSEKKQKKGILSKLKSLAIGKQNKKIQVKVDSTDSGDVVEDNDQFERKLDRKALDTDKEFVIRELESSPTVPKRQIMKKIQSKLPQLEKKKEAEFPKTSESIEPHQDTSTTNDVKIDSKSKTTDSAKKIEIPIEEEIIAKINITKDVASVFNSDEKRLFAIQKLQSMEFIIKEKESTFADIRGGIKDNMLESKNISSMKSDISKETRYEYQEKNIDKELDLGQKLITTVTPRTKYSPSAPPINQIHTLPSETKMKSESSVIHRVVSPLSPTKTVFTEIRKRESNPDKTIYILSEGYIINKEESVNSLNRNAEVIVNETRDIQEPGLKKSDVQSGENQLGSIQKIQNRSPTGGINSKNSNIQLTSTIPQVQTSMLKSITVQENVPTQHSKGKEYTELNRFIDMEKTPHVIKPTEMKGGFTGQVKSQIKNENDYSPPTRPPQENLEVTRAREHTKRRTFREMEDEPCSFVTETKIEQHGDITQRYTTSCYFHQVRTPVWYEESLLIDLEEKTQKIREKIYYDEKLRPDHWSETYTTDLTSKKDKFHSEVFINIEQEPNGVHYISLEPQQIQPSA